MLYIHTNYSTYTSPIAQIHHLQPIYSSYIFTPAPCDPAASRFLCHTTSRRGPLETLGRKSAWMVVLLTLLWGLLCPITEYPSAKRGTRGVSSFPLNACTEGVQSNQALRCLHH